MSEQTESIKFVKAIERLAGAVEIKSDVQDVKRELSVLTEAVRGHLSKQDVINRRLEEQQKELARQGSCMLERLVAVEQAVGRVPQLEVQVIALRTQFAKYVGGGLMLVMIVNALLGWAIKLWGN